MAPRASGLGALLALTWLLAGCGKDAPKRAIDAGGEAGSLASSPQGAPVDAGLDGASPGDGGVKDAGPDAALVEDAVPSGTSTDLVPRARHLLEAVVQDNPDLATDLLFPRDAYSIAREGDDPGKQWELKLVPSYQRDVHTLHKRLKGSTAAVFVDFEIGHTIQQITPHKKEWKRPLWRVKHSKLTFTLDGKTEHIDVAEMVAWRGAWYVVKLR